MPATAQQHNRVNLSKSISSSQLGSAASLNAASLNAVLLNFNLVIRNSILGVAQLKIDRLKPFSRAVSDDNHPATQQTLYLGQGQIKLRRGLKPDTYRQFAVSVSADLNSTKKPYLRLRFTRPRKSGRVFEITVFPDSNLSFLRHVSLRALDGKTCSSEIKSMALKESVNNSEQTNYTKPETRTLSAYKTYTISTDCDYECSQLLGTSAANDRILEFINSANTFYNRDLAFDLKVTSQTLRSTAATYSYNLTDPASLLSRLYEVAISLPSADLKHLITGKNMDGNVVGLSYLKVVCSRPEYSIGFSQHENSLLTPIIIAHELGHNFGADHDPRDQGIMVKVVTPPFPDYFSDYSKTQIMSHINDLGSLACNEEADNSPPASNPVPTYNSQLTARYSSSSFSAKIFQPNGNNCLAYLSASSKESGVFKDSNIIDSFLIASQQSQRLSADNINKVILKSRAQSSAVYLGVKSVCSEGTGYSYISKLNVGSYSLRKRKNKTITSVRQWINQLKVKLHSA